MTLVSLTWAFFLNFCCSSHSRLAASFIFVMRTSSAQSSVTGVIKAGLELVFNGI